jgi:hypothetical protein
MNNNSMYRRRLVTIRPFSICRANGPRRRHCWNIRIITCRNINTRILQGAYRRRRRQPILPMIPFPQMVVVVTELLFGREEAEEGYVPWSGRRTRGRLCLSCRERPSYVEVGLSNPFLDYLFSLPSLFNPPTGYNRPSHSSLRRLVVGIIRVPQWRQRRHLVGRSCFVFFPQQHVATAGSFTPFRIGLCLVRR